MSEDAELAALRRRAYGPRADIVDDPAALARLTELERGALGATRGTAERAASGSHEPAAAADVAVGPRGSGVALTEPATDIGTAVPPPLERIDRPRRHPAWHTAMVVAVAALTLLVGAGASAQTVQSPPVAAPTTPTAVDRPAVGFVFTADPASKILLRIPLDGGSGYFLDLPEPEKGPEFPTERALRWTQPLGDYYGWRLWIARDQDENLCMLITATDDYSRCVTPDELAVGALFLSVPFAEVTESERPAGMTESQSIGFWWVPGDAVLVLTGRTTDTIDP